jgi:type IV pilus secretin PilQ/predicted competence protein
MERLRGRIRNVAAPLAAASPRRIASLFHRPAGTEAPLDPRLAIASLKGAQDSEPNPLPPATPRQTVLGRLHDRIGALREGRHGLDSLPDLADLAPLPPLPPSPRPALIAERDLPPLPPQAKAIAQRAPSKPLVRDPVIRLTSLEQPVATTAPEASPAQETAGLSKPSDTPLSPAPRPAGSRPPSPYILEQEPTETRVPPPPPPAMPGVDPLADPPEPRGDGGVELHFENIDVRQVLELFSRREKLNVLISPNVSGPITVNLDGVTREEALQAILRLGNLESKREGNLIYVYTSDEVKQINTRARKLSSRVYRLNYVRAGELAQMITPFLSPDGKATSTPETAEGIDENANFAAGLPTVSTGASGGAGGGARAGGSGTTGGNTLSGEDVMIIQDYEENLALIDTMVQRLDVMPVQVLLEAIIVRVDLNRTQSLGVNYGAIDSVGRILGTVGNASSIGATTGFVPAQLLSAGRLLPNTNFTNGSSNSGLNFGFIGGSTTAFIQVLETLGKTNVLATPRILVLNKQRAEIQLGQRLGYKTLVTNLTSTVQQIQFINTGTLLRLRPFISEDGMIRMEIHPERSTGLIDSNGVPQVNTARLTTNVLVPNGATLVIGGLIDNQDDTTQNGIPGLGRLPGIGAAFRSRNQDLAKSEIVVMLTPRIWNPADPEGQNCAPTTKTAIDMANRTSQKIALGADRPAKDGLLGGRLYVWDTPHRADKLQARDPGGKPFLHTVHTGENFWTISKTYYKSGRYYMALWAANKDKVKTPEALRVGQKVAIPRLDQLDPEMIQPVPDLKADSPLAPADDVPVLAPPPSESPGPFGPGPVPRDPATQPAAYSRPSTTTRPAPRGVPSGN